MWRAGILALVSAAFVWSTSDGSVLVSQRIAVDRGASVEDISGAFTLTGLQSLGEGDSCKIRLASASCGTILPRDFQCSYDGNVTYQHFGCFSDTESLSLQISVVSAGSAVPTSVHYFTLPVHVNVNEADRLSNLSLALQPSRDGEAVPFRVLFPQDLIGGGCYYSLVSAGDLPFAGEVSGWVDQPIPCGFTPKPLPLYRSLLPANSSVPSCDYVRLKITTASSASTSRAVFAVLRLEFEEPGDPAAQELPDLQLTVEQVLKTPVSLPRPTGFSPTRVLRYRFPVLPQGRFAGLQTMEVGGAELPSETSFTSREPVAFLPDEEHLLSLGNEPSAATYPYAVTDEAGSVVARGRASVEVLQRDWESGGPSHRTNRGLPVLEGASAVLDASRLQFYSISASTMRLWTPPQWGKLVFAANGSLVANESLPLEVLRDGSLKYLQTSIHHPLADHCVWLLEQSSMAVFFPIFIAPLNNLMSQPAIPASLHFFASVWMPLDVFISLDSLLYKAVVSLTAVRGEVIGRASSFEDGGGLYCPYVPEALAHNTSQYAAHSDNLWYLPSHNSPLDTIHFTVTYENGRTTEHSIPLVRWNTSLEEAFSVSALEMGPTLLTNKPASVSISERRHLITRSHLYAEAFLTAPSNLQYRVLRPPAQGRLCLAVANCSASIENFTQHSIDQHHVYYQLSSPQSFSHSDNFSFALGTREHLFTFAGVNIAVSDKQFWVLVGRSKVVKPKVLKHYIKLFSIRKAKQRLNFLVTARPMFGNLTLHNFTFKDLANGQVSYSHGGTQSCSDYIEFVITDLRNGQQHRGSLSIAIRGEQDSSTTSVTNGQWTLVNQPSFMLSPNTMLMESNIFCSPNFTWCTLLDTPTEGVLSLYQPELGTAVQLLANDSFTQRDIDYGFVRYFLYREPSPTRNISDGFHFNVSNPVTNDNMGLAPRIGAIYKVDILAHVSSQEASRSVSVVVDSPQIVTELLPSSFYGYVFKPGDIRVAGAHAAIRPEEVLVSVEMEPHHGMLQRVSTSASARRSYKQTSSFTLLDVEMRHIHYTASFNHLLLRDKFTFRVIVNKSVSAEREFEFQWCVTYVDHIRTSVEEEEGSVTVLLRCVCVCVMCVCVCVCVCVCMCVCVI